MQLIMKIAEEKRMRNHGNVCQLPGTDDSQGAGLLAVVT